MKRVPRSIQQSMPGCTLHDNGIMEFSGKVYSATFLIQDVDFSSGSDDKIHLLYDFYRTGEEAYFNYSYKPGEKRRTDYRDYVAPDTLRFRHFEIEIHNRYARVFYVRDWGVSLKPETLSNMMELRINMMISIDLISMSASETKRFIWIQMGECVHRGIDIPCPSGSEVLASNSGTVIHAGVYGTGGNAVLIDCGDGMVNYYYHLSRYNVSEGDTVQAGDVIAFSGNTGNSTGPHLHFGVSINGEYVDPMEYLN